MVALYIGLFLLVCWETGNSKSHFLLLTLILYCGNKQGGCEYHIHEEKTNKPVAGKYCAMLPFEFHETNSDELNKNDICKFQTSQKISVKFM
jgi:hypothetical protein